MRKEFVIRGKTASGETEVLNFGKYKQGYAYRLTEFTLYPSVLTTTTDYDLAGSLTAAKTFEDPSNPNFNNDGLIATASHTYGESSSTLLGSKLENCINDTFLITQNLILAVVDNKTGAPMAVNWQCRFESVKMTSSEEAVVNYKQFTISDE